MRTTSMLLDNDILARQLNSLERRRGRTGRDTIDHPKGGHDDIINAAAGALVYAKLAHAAVTVTPANASATADTSQGAAGAAWQNLGNIVVAENANGDFASPQTNTTLVLTAPSGWQFQANTGSVTFAASKNIKFSS